MVLERVAITPFPFDDALPATGVTPGTAALVAEPSIIALFASDVAELLIIALLASDVAELPIIALLASGRIGIAHRTVTVHRVGAGRVGIGQIGSGRVASSALASAPLASVALASAPLALASFVASDGMLCVEGLFASTAAFGVLLAVK